MQMLMELKERVYNHKEKATYCARMSRMSGKITVWLGFNFSVKHGKLKKKRYGKKQTSSSRSSFKVYFH